MEDSRSGIGGWDARRVESRPAPVTRGEDEGWAARGRYAAFGVSWTLQADDVSAYHLLLDRLPPGAVPTSSKNVQRSYIFRTLPAEGPGEEVSYLLLADRRPLIRSSDPEEIAAAFEENLKCVVAEYSPRRIFVRAGVVGWHDRAIIIPGGPRSGKSTLVRALVACGATYYSDEYAVLDGNAVHPFRSRMPEWLDEGGSLTSLLDDVRGGPPMGSLPVGIVLFAPYQAGAVFKPKLLARGKSLLGLFKHAVAAQRHPEQVLRVLDTVTRRCNALEGVRGDAQGVASYLLDRLV